MSSTFLGRVDDGHHHGHLWRGEPRDHLRRVHDAPEFHPGVRRLRLLHAGHPGHLRGVLQGTADAQLELAPSAPVQGT